MEPLKKIQSTIKRPENAEQDCGEARMSELTREMEMGTLELGRWEVSKINIAETIEAMS